MSTTFLTLADAAERLGITKQEVRESKRFTIVSNLGTGALVSEADVVRAERQRDDAQRREEDLVARRPAILAAQIADDERWLNSIRARGGEVLWLDEQLERREAELERYEAEAAHIHAARAHGEDYAYALDESEQYLNRARERGLRGRWLDQSERRLKRTREELAR